VRVADHITYPRAWNVNTAAGGRWADGHPSVLGIDEPVIPREGGLVPVLDSVVVDV
jgi:hypothetical protein